MQKIDRARDYDALLIDIQGKLKALLYFFYFCVIPGLKLLV
jgi:hypothetical protein